MELVGIGFGNLLAADRIISVINPDSAPIKRVVTEARAQGLLVDATQARKPARLSCADSGHGCAFLPFSRKACFGNGKRQDKRRIK